MSDTTITQQCGVRFQTPILDRKMPKANTHCPDLLNKPNITEYRLLSEGVAFTAEIGPHGGGHYIIK